MTLNTGHPGRKATTAPIRLGPNDRPFRRAQCWRPDCRDRFGNYATVTFTARRQIVAFCHRQTHDDLSARADAWKHGDLAA